MAEAQDKLADTGRVPGGVVFQLDSPAGRANTPDGYIYGYIVKTRPYLSQNNRSLQA